MSGSIRWPTRIVWILGLLLLFLLPRLLLLDADPPRAVIVGWPAHELWREPVAKAHEARNWALFGVWQTNSADNYQFWRLQSPVWVYPLAAAFRIFGTSYAVLRAFSVLFAAVSIIAMIDFTKRNFGSYAWAAVPITLLSIDPIAIVYDRGGFLETGVAALSMVGITLLDRAAVDRRWLFAIPIILAAALLVKLAAVAVVPLFIGAWCWLWWSSGKYRWGLMVVAVGMAMALGIYILQDGYWRTLTFNFKHVVLATPKPGSATNSWGTHGLSSWKQISDKVSLFKAMFGLLAPLGVGFLILKIFRWRQTTFSEVLIIVWWVTGLMVFASLKIAAPRFALILYPATVLIASFGIRELWRALERWGSLRAVLAGVTGAFLFIYQGQPTWSWMSRPNYQLQQTAQFLTKKIRDPEHAVLVGAWAGAAVLETKVKHYFVREPFNMSPEILRSLGITHLLVTGTGDFTVEAIQKAAPEIWDSSKKVGEVRLYGKKLQLRAVTHPTPATNE